LPYNSLPNPPSLPLQSDDEYSQEPIEEQVSHQSNRIALAEITSVSPDLTEQDESYSSQYNAFPSPPSIPGPMFFPQAKYPQNPFDEQISHLSNRIALAEKTSFSPEPKESDTSYSSQYNTFLSPPSIPGPVLFSQTKHPQKPFGEQVLHPFNRTMLARETSSLPELEAQTENPYSLNSSELMFTSADEFFSPSSNLFPSPANIHKDTMFSSQYRNLQELRRLREFIYDIYSNIGKNQRKTNQRIANIEQVYDLYVATNENQRIMNNRVTDMEYALTRLEKNSASLEQAVLELTKKVAEITNKNQAALNMSISLVKTAAPLSRSSSSPELFKPLASKMIERTLKSIVTLSPRHTHRH